MSRYSTTRNIKDENGRSRAQTTIFPVVPLSESDIYIKTTSPERLDILAHKFYKDQSLWWIIAAANGIGKGSFYIPANTRIRIPPKDGINDIIKEKNTTR